MELRRRLAGGLPVLVATMAVACAEGSSGIQAIVTDSAGVRIVTNPPGTIDAAEEWNLAPEPRVDIGSGVSPEVPLYRVRDVVALEDDRVAVGTNVPSRVLVFGADGALLAELGRAGEGPGEFASVRSVVMLAADSLAVWDDRRRRISVFDAAGRFSRDVDLSGLAPMTPVAAGSVDQPAAWTYLLPSSAGAFVLFSVGMFGPGEGVRRVAFPSHRISHDGAEVATFGPFPGEETYMSPVWGLAPYLFAATSHGVTSGEALVVGTAESQELRYFRPNGSLDRIVRWPDHDRAMDGALVEEWTDWLDDQFRERPPDQRAAFERMFEEIPERERFPPYGGLVAAADGSVWVGEYPGQLGYLGISSDFRRMPARRWLVLDADGRLVATVRTQEGFLPYAVRDGRSWGVFTDELDVESVRAYEVVRP